METNYFAVLAGHGYSCVPIMPGTKVPGEYKNGGWERRVAWPDMAGKKPTPTVCDFWSRYPDTGVGVVLGAGVCAIDIDVDNPDQVGRLLEILPDSPVKKRGKRGFTLFYWDANPRPIESRKFMVSDLTVVEVLARGRQTVIPPTIHPETKQPYVWLTERTLFDTPATELPLLPQSAIDQIAAFIDEENAAFYAGAQSIISQYTQAKAAGDPIPTIREMRAVKARDLQSDPEITIWSDMNAKALQMLDFWVPDLPVPRLRKTGGRWEGVPFFRPSHSGNPTEKRKLNLKFYQTGIRDFGTDQSYSPIDIVMVVLDYDLDQAFAWLEERVDPKDPIKLAIKIKEKRQEPESPAEPDRDVLNVPGVVGEIARWIADTSPRAVPELCLMAAIGYWATAISRKYIGPTGVAPNLYMVGIADSGVGKEHPLACIKALDAAVNSRLVSSGNVSSDSALESLLGRSPSTLLPIDEFGLFLKSVQAHRAAGHVAAIRQMMLEIYSKSNSIFFGKERADPRNGAARRIFSPCLTVMGTTTPETFYSGISEANLTDGFLNRFLFFASKPVKERGRRRKIKPPADLVQLIQNALIAGGNIPNGVVSAEFEPVVKEVDWEGDAERLWDDFEEWQIGIMDNPRHGVEINLVRRAAEMAQKLALIRAVGRNARDPFITATDMVWGIDLVRASVDWASVQIGKNLIDPRRERGENVVLILNHICAAREVGMSRRELTRARGMRSISTKELDDILRGLVDSGEIISERIGRGRSLSHRYYHEKFVEIEGDEE